MVVKCESLHLEAEHLQMRPYFDELLLLAAHAAVSGLRVQNFAQNSMLEPGKSD